ncbi:hypothetical protein JZM27_02660 [Providencia huaxiensis]|uniref:hypothetical protein n=1 Tax=Providencia huaxiensis TaxID=2027290 RepID=UPI0019D18E9D|nr:hypothetical protein [Providencia huaxiensis]ELR5076602.1 hypothetical protein [Providencia rettgeri]MBN6360137.1 hypothetical protein [Providencia huaxiensis]
MSVDYLVVGGSLQGKIITRDNLVKKLAITNSVISSSQKKTSQNIGYTLDVHFHSFNGSRYAIAVNGSFGTDILDELIAKYNPNPIPNDLIK